jgi:serine/threonine protein kinase
MSLDEKTELLREALPSGWELEDTLSTGGQGAVFRGRLEGAPAAIKVFCPSNPRRLQRELAWLTTLSCPHLVKILGHETIYIDGAMCSVVAYELLEGRDLRCHLTPAAEALDKDLLCCIGREMATAVAALWSNRIVHRDIKPGNIVRAKDGRHVLVDLGLARHLDRLNLGAPGIVPGTMGYMSPEQARGRRNLTVHSDVFSLGVTLYEVAAKRHPYQGQQHTIGSVRPQPLIEVRPDLDANLCGALEKMLATIPSERPDQLATLFGAAG